MTIHSPAQCGGFKRKIPDETKSETKVKFEPKEKKLKLKTALANVTTVEDGDNSDGY